MAKVKIDFKQILLQHGERIGLVVAGVLALLFLVTALFMPGRGLFSGSPSEKAKAIEETTTWVNNKLRDPNNVPGEQDKPGEAKLIAYQADVVQGEKYRVASLGDVGPKGSLGRRNPRILSVEEAFAGASRVNLRSYIFDENDPPRLLVLVGEGGSGAGAGAGDRQLASGLRPMGGRGASGASGGSGGMRPPSMGARGGAGRGMLGAPGQFGKGDDSTKEKKTLFVALTDLDKNNDKTAAEQVWPLHVAVIAASFPYKKQIEEFRAALALKANGDVLTEVSKEKSKDATGVPAFRFLGVEVQRRELDGDGKPLTKFAPVNVNEDYKRYLFLTGRRFEKDDPKLAPVSFTGLVMPKLQEFPDTPKKQEAGGGPGPGSSPRVGGAGSTPEADVPHKSKYPKVEEKLTLLAQALDNLKDKNPGAVAKPPQQFRNDDFDVFNQSTAPATETSRSGGTGDPEGTKTAGTELPDYCLVRVVDVSLQPGKTYEYQLRIRMANPNFGRTDVANPDYAKPADLVSDWSKQPIVAHIGPDQRYYAVDEKELLLAGNKDARAVYRGPYANVAFNKDRVVILQAQRWVGVTRFKGSDASLRLGEWTVAERFGVMRGEYVGREERVEVPYWRYTREDFVLASDSGTTRRRRGIELSFGYNAGGNQPEAILVDFDSGRHGYEREVSRTDDKVNTQKVTDVNAADALLLNPDGKLVLLEGAEDAKDKERTTTLKEVRDRLSEVGYRNKPKDKKDPFGE